MMDNDMDLVRQYAAGGSEEAFETLVSRHVSLVHSAALRQAHDPNLAEEVTQTVFIILARKAGSLSEKTILPGWLYRTTRYVAAAAVKIQLRRERREQEAQMDGTVQEAQDDSAWEQFSLLLDEAMAQLRDKDRDALVLRYFQNRTLREVGIVLGVDEYAAQKRVARALEKLRSIFAERGAQSTTAIIAGAISSNSVHAAPAALAKAAAAAALAKGAGGGGATLSLTSGALRLMAWTNAKTAVVGGVLLLLAGTAAVVAVVAERHPANSALKPSVESVADSPTPKRALLAMSQVMETGDAKAYVNSYEFKTMEELKLRAILERLVTANARFNRALADEFGPEAAKGVFASLPFVVPADVIQSATEKIEGDSATVTLMGGKSGRPIQFTKIDNEWKMAADGFWHLGPAMMSGILDRAIKALDETSLEIPRKRYKAPMEAVDAMKQKAR
jgi:RNA polymerase sigma factor (sigma-70 family)